MKRLLSLLFIAVVSTFYAFQHDTPAPKHPEVNEWIEKFNRADANYAYDSAHICAAKIIEIYQQKGLLDAARDWYHLYFQGIVNDANLAYEDQLAAIDGKLPDIQASKSPRLLCDYYTAKTELYSVYAELDSCEYYFGLTEPLMLKHYTLQQQTYAYLTVAYAFLDKPIKGKTFWEKSSKIVPQLDKEKDYETLKSYYQIGSVLFNYLGEYEKSININQELLNTLSKKLSYSELAIAYCDIAAAYSSLQDYQSAIDYYDKAIEYNQFDDVSDQDKAISYYNLASSLMANNLYQEAIVAGKKALLLLDENDYENILITYTKLANSFTPLSQTDSALFYLEKAFPLSKHVQNNYIKSAVFDSYSFYYRTEKNYKQAILFMDKSINLILTMGNKSPRLASLLKQKADIYLSNQQLLEAWGCSIQAINALYTENISAENIKSINFDRILDKGILNQILQNQIKTLQTSIKSPNNPLKATLEDIYDYAKLSAKALDYQTSSFKSEGSKMDKLSKEAQPVYERVVRIALELHQKTGKQQYLAEAFQFAEQSKSMLLMDALQESHAANFAGIPDSLLEKERSLQRQIGRAEKAKLDATLAKDSATIAEQEKIIFETNHAAKELEHRFEKEFPEYFALKYAPVTIDLPKVQAALDEKTTVLEYVEGEKDVYLFSISKSTINAQIIEVSDAERKQMEDFLKSVMDPLLARQAPIKSYNTLVLSAHHFYQKFIPQLPTSTERLIVIPDGKLSYLPFDVLLQTRVDSVSSEEEISYNNLDYLLKKYRINYNYSLSLWARQQQTKEKVINGRILAMSATYAKDTAIINKRNPRERKARLMLDELPGAQSEVEGLSKNFAGEFYHANDANEQSFKQKAPQFGILHLAMHGLVNSSAPEYSSLAFTDNGDEQFDNFLYAYEIKQLGLQAGLVVLSACETGLGKFQRGEGVVSIGRGFMYAGAPSVLMTLWSLNDQSGATIVQQFYHNLQAGMDKDEAIRQAKLKYINEHNGLALHPGLWACFVQVGDYDNISVDSAGGGNMGWYAALGGGGLLLLAAGVAMRRKKE